jgi:isopentenyl phosphate kinase
MIILKLGGSVITDKRNPMSFKASVVNQIAIEIASVYRYKKIALVHGAGSYGHPLAQSYALKSDGNAAIRQLGVAKTHCAMLRLSAQIADIFLSHDLPIYPLTASSIFILNQTEVSLSWDNVINDLLQKNYIPLLSGDTAMALDKDVDILSGDQIIAFLANRLKPEKVIFLMDIDGIYDRNPSLYSHAKLLHEIDMDTKIDFEMNAIDVSGGLKNKIEQAFKMPCPVFFINGNVQGAIAKAVQGKAVGSVVKRVLR